MILFAVRRHYGKMVDGAFSTSPRLLYFIKVVSSRRVVLITLFVEQDGQLMDMCTKELRTVVLPFAPDNMLFSMLDCT